jgi:hypothetical protein
MEIACLLFTWVSSIMLFSDRFSFCKIELKRRSVDVGSNYYITPSSMPDATRPPPHLRVTNTIEGVPGV